MDIHASCAAREGAGMLLLGAPGSGKSDLLLRLLEVGFRLVADDRVVVERGIARARPGHEGLIEVRGLGILRLPFLATAELRLALCLVDTPVRLPEAGAVYAWPDGAAGGLPLVEIDPRPASAALVARLALDCVLGRAESLVGALAA